MLNQQLTVNTCGFAMMLNKKLALLFLLITIPFNSVLAEIYKWVDESGKVHFGDQAKQGAEQIKLDIPAATYDDTKNSTQEINKRINALNQQTKAKQLQQHNDKIRKDRLTQKQKKSSALRCQYYKDKLANLEYEWELKKSRKAYKQSQKDKYLTKKDRYKRDIKRNCT